MVCIGMVEASGCSLTELAITRVCPRRAGIWLSGCFAMRQASQLHPESPNEGKMCIHLNNIVAISWYGDNGGEVYQLVAICSCIPLASRTLLSTA